MNKIQIICPAKGFSNSDFVVFTEDGHERDNRLYFIHNNHTSLVRGTTIVLYAISKKA